ncbi:MAG TPA: hypothetical protein PKO09_00770 [Anaerolineae bacterium]|nr:hypothetical protein [Anaerolineae bacterium]
MSRAANQGEAPRPADLLAWLAQHAEDAYLVGGCIRDRLLGRPLHDLDLVVPSGGLALARRVSDAFGGDYYPLDSARGTGRALFRTPEGTPLVVDVSELRGPDLPSDLAERDFTVNALAEPVASPGCIVDLFGGAADLAAGTIRPVGPDSVRNDPVRALRAVRLAAELGFSLAPETAHLIRRDGIGLLRIAGERIRDELAKVLVLATATPSLLLLDELGVLTLIFRELEPLRAQPDRPSHPLSPLAHSLETVRGLEALLAPLLEAPGAPPDLPPWLGSWPLVLGALGPRVAGYLSEQVGDSRPRYVALKLAALLHHAGTPATAQPEPGGRPCLPGSAEEARRLAGGACRRLHLTNAEIRWVECIVLHQATPRLLEADGTGLPPDAGGCIPHQPTQARAVYRFFRDTGDAGVAVLFLSLSDLQAAPGAGRDASAGQALLGWAVGMMRDYFERYSEAVAPLPLVDGHDLMEAFRLPPGPQVGALLEAVREAQAAGELATREAALDLVRRLLLHPAGPG